MNGLLFHEKVAVSLAVIFVILFAWAIAFPLGYHAGKRAADRYYANALCFHGSTNGVPVKLIPPIKVRTAPPVASVEEPR